MSTNTERYTVPPGSNIWRTFEGMRRICETDEEFADQAAFLLRTAAEERIRAGLSPEAVMEQLLRESVSPDGAVWVTKQLTLHAVSQAMNDVKAFVRPGTDGRIVVRSDVGGMTPVASTGDEHLRQLETEVRGWSSTEGFGFGINELDTAYGRLFPGEVLAVVGAPGSMKTTLALSAAEWFLLSQTAGKVLFFSLDMPARTVMARRLMREMDCYYYDLLRRIREGDESVTQAKRRLAAYDKGRFVLIGKQPRPYSWQQISDITVQAAPELLIIDYLTLIGTYRSELEAVYDLMPKIKALADNSGIAVILLSQMGRGSRSAQRSSSGGHAAGGHYVEDAVDVEIELLKEDSEEEGKSVVVATVTKTRKGRSGGNFALDFNPRTLSFGSTAQSVRRTKPNTKVFEI